MSSVVLTKLFLADRSSRCGGGVVVKFGEQSIEILGARLEREQVIDLHRELTGWIDETRPLTEKDQLPWPTTAEEI